MTRLADGGIAGAYAYRDCSSEVADLLIRPSPQVGLRLPHSNQYDYFLPDEDKQSKTLDARANVDRYCSD